MDKAEGLILFMYQDNWVDFCIDSAYNIDMIVNFVGSNIYDYRQNK
ncbi:MAG: hypothetical protein BWX78_01523 [Firmicutes bacterium ADurb.Bin099]|nr:MAG: hypothetical protein BWX78_01523 [Firmicutes bacterium ADurb.Bin099]